MTTKTSNQSSSESTKVSKAIVESARELAEIRAEMRKLDARKAELTRTLEEAFGKDSEAKTSEFTKLTHNNLEVANLNWVTREEIDKKELAKSYPEAYEACRYGNKYSVVKL